MNDRFKFRLWDKAIGQMSYDVCVGFIKDGACRDWVCADICDGQINYCDKRLNDIVLMQCTGLKDKNGKLIYEGDYIKNLKTNTIYKVFWEDKATCFMLKSTRFGGVISTYMMFEEYPNDLEVIGNIYENEDLIKCENL